MYHSSYATNAKISWERGAIKEWYKLVFDSKRMNVALSDLNSFAGKYDILPNKNDIFNMFRMIRPSHVKVVFVGQSPYPGLCPITNIPYAFGPAFLPNPKCVTTPMTLKNIIREVYRDVSQPGDTTRCNNKSPSEILTNWIKQGVLLLNASLTLGVNCPKYLEDHSVLWEEVLRDILSTISKELDPVFVFVGKEAWKFENCVVSQKYVIKVSHPVARRDTSTPWIGSNVFSNVSRLLATEKKVAPIDWL